MSNVSSKQCRKMTTVKCCRSALLLMTDPWRACFCIFTLRSYCVNWELQQGLWLQLLETGQGKCTLIILKPLIQRIISCYYFPCTVWFLGIPVKVVFLRILCYAFQPKEQTNNFSQNWKNFVVESPQYNVVLLYCFCQILHELVFLSSLCEATVLTESYSKGFDSSF